MAIGTPKSNDSYRVIPVPPKLQSCAVRLRDTDKKFIWEAGVKDQPCNPSYFSKRYKQAISSVEGVRLLTPLCYRRTYVSQMQGISVDIDTIRNMAGHVEADMTRHYLRVQDLIRKDAVIRFSDEFVDFEEE